MNKLHKKCVGSGRDIILLHGWGFNSQIWQPLLAYLPDYRVTTIDLPGFGQSACCFDQQQAILPQYIAQILEVAPTKAIWLGWSLGGLLASKIALMAPERVEQVINVASTPYFAAETNWPGMRLQAMQAFEAQLASQARKTLREFIALQVHGLSNARVLLRQLWQQMDTSYEAMTLSLPLLRQIDLRQELVHLNMPCHYFLGKHDIIVPQAVGTMISNINPKISVTLFDDAAHTPFLSCQQAFINQLRLCINNT